MAVQLIGGLAYPRLTVLLGLVYIVGRLLYGIGYRASGPSGRSTGARIFDVAIIGLLVAAIASAVEVAGGVSGLVSFALSYTK